MPTVILEAPPALPWPTDRLVTGEELLNHPEWGNCELIRGKVVPVCRPNSQHGYLMLEVGAELRSFVKKRKLGTVIVGDAGVYLETDPDTVRGPDVYFISAKKMPINAIPPSFQKLPPELCVEIVSPRDKSAEGKEKIAQFLAMGVNLIWVIDPKKRTAQILRQNGTVSVVPTDGVLSGEDILPGFELALTDLFAALG